MHTKKRVHIIVSCIFFITAGFIYLPLASIHLNSDMPLASNGVLDLSTWDFEENGYVRLDGEWIYYDNQLLEPTLIEEGKGRKLINVPDFIWGRGSGTYYLKIKLSSSHSVIGLKTQSIRMAHSLFINGQKLAGSGQPSNGEERSVPGNTPYTEFFFSEDNTIEIVIQVDNNSFVDMGIGESIYLGKSEDISLLNSIQFSTNFCITLILLLFSVYNLIIFLIRGKEKFHLYAALYFFVLMVSILFSGEKIILQLFHDIPFEVAYKLKDTFGFISVIVFIRLLREVESRAISNSANNLLSIPIFLYIFTIILFPYNIYTNIIYIMWVYAALFLFLIIVRVLYVAIRGESTLKRNESIILFATFGMITFSLITEIVSSIYSLHLNKEYGFIGFVTLFIIFLAIKTSNLMISFEGAKDQASNYEMAYLNTQIKPHFLYNTLSHIISFCYTEPKKAAHLLSKLTIYLRLVLEGNNKSMNITLSQELELINAYVEIEKVRLAYGLDVNIYVDDNIGDVLIPPLLIQPFVENAIRHGIFNKGSYGVVTLYINKIDEKLHIEIKDDGVGMEKEKLLQLLDTPGSRSESAGMGISIKNIHNRLESIDGSSLSIHSDHFQGTLIIIELPINK
ncbi:hypothetical protein BTR22_03105 [Alkalihalophilus pseudofirmus]|uniref:sensor histidine kinase n=1 Tax=Alkalihalophilus pseudofirmus TaxID=79885 RepID=UPI00095168DD|nr:hypothetical protein BTR22_03105 [Alkalihalophilus pseudofirmus]